MPPTMTQYVEGPAGNLSAANLLYVTHISAHQVLVSMAVAIIACGRIKPCNYQAYGPAF